MDKERCALVLKIGMTIFLSIFWVVMLLGSVLLSILMFEPPVRDCFNFLSGCLLTVGSAHTFKTVWGGHDGDNNRTDDRGK